MQHNTWDNALKQRQEIIAVKTKNKSEKELKKGPSNPFLFT